MCRYEVEKLTASQRLDLNLEKGRMRDELQVGPTSAQGLAPAGLGPCRPLKLSPWPPPGRVEQRRIGQLTVGASVRRRCPRLHLLLGAATWSCQGGRVVVHDVGIGRTYGGAPVVRDLHQLWEWAVNPLRDCGSLVMAVGPADTKWHCIGWMQVSEGCGLVEAV